MGLTGPPEGSLITRAGWSGGTGVAAVPGMSSRISPVVVGFDFSHSGAAALHRAVTLAARAPVHVLHVVCVVDPKACGVQP